MNRQPKAPPSLMIPPSARVTMSATRRSFLRNAAIGGALVTTPGLLAACGSDSGGGGGSDTKTVTFGVNEAKDSGPAYERMKGFADNYAKKSGVEVKANYVDHNTFQESISTYLQGSPDDVFTWFAGFRMQQFAEDGLLSDISDLWPIDGMTDAFKGAATSSDGKQYLVPYDYYPWALFYKKSVFEKNGWTAPTTFDDFNTLLKDMQGKGITPFAFGDKDGWPAMGTFDILNMRMNGYDFHIGLMAGKEKWTDPKVKAVFEAWKKLLPYYSDGGVGQKWQDASTQLVQGKAGMYFLGTFASQTFKGTDAEGDLAFFPFPTMGTSFDSELGIDAPIDGLLLSKAPKNLEGAKALMECFSTGAAQQTYLAADPSNVAAAKDADTSKYTPLQKAAADVIANSGAIAQFLDRDTIPAFAGPQGMQPQLQSFIGNPDQDLDAYLQGIQDLWDQIASEQ